MYCFNKTYNARGADVSELRENLTQYLYHESRDDESLILTLCVKIVSKEPEYSVKRALLSVITIIRRYRLFQYLLGH